MQASPNSAAGRLVLAACLSLALNAVLFIGFVRAYGPVLQALCGGPA